MNRRQFVTRSAQVAATASLATWGRWAGAKVSRLALPAGRSYDYEACFIPCYGQSLSLGAGGVPALSRRQRFDSLMFAGGTIARGYSSNLTADYGNVLPLVENNNAPGFDTSLILYPGESPLSGAFEATKELMASQDGLSTSAITYRLLGSLPGQGGVGILALSPGTGPYQRLLYEVGAAKTLAAEAGATFGVPALLWLQGESDGGLTQAEYHGYLQGLFASLNADIRAVTGQPKDVQFLQYQTAYAACFQIACAQYQLATEQANVHVASPAYPFQTQGDQTHLMPVGYKLLGAYLGSAYKRIVVNHDAWLPLSPRSIHASGSTIVVNLNCMGTAVVADMFATTTTSPIKAALGFTLTDAAGANLDIDGQVKITGPAQITVTTPKPVQPGFTLAYGAGGGNIRDNFGTQYVFDGGGLQQPMNNWLTVFNFIFSANGTSTALTATPTVATANGTVSLVATVTAALGSAIPAGTVTFTGIGTAGSATLGVATLAGGVATLLYRGTNLPPGSYSITATYSGSGLHAASTAPSVPVTVVGP